MKNNCKVIRNKTMNIAAWLLIACVGCTQAFAQSDNGNGQGNGNNKDKIRNFKVLQNSYSTRCAYKYNVVLKVKYKLKSADFRDIVIHGTDVDGIVRELTRSTVDYGNGAVVITFDAGDCLTDISIDME